MQKQFWASRLILVIFVLAFAWLLVGCGEDEGEISDSETYPDPAGEETDLPVEVELQPTAPVDSGEAVETGDTAEWLILLYLDADDEVLEQDIFTDLNEAERVGSTDRMSIVAQIDRYKGGFDGDGDWSSTKRFYITQDADLKQLNSEELDDLGEVNMADGQTLVDFITWGIENFPAKHYALILSDHGMGWPGGYFDPDPGGSGEHDLALADDFGDGIWLMELDQALAQARQQSGIERLDLIGFDSCLMGQLEVFSAMQPHARYMVASEELEPGLGWAYADFLIQLAFDAEMDGAGLATAIVDAYIVKDQLITDDVARSEYAAENFDSENPSANQVAEELSFDVTLAAVDLDLVPDVVFSLDSLAYAMSAEDQDLIAEARAYAQAFESPLDEDLPSPFIDLGNFASMLVEADISADVNAAAEDVLSSIGAAVLAEKHGEGRPGATGIAFHFPVYDLYTYANNYDYTTVAAPFTDFSEWDEFLDFHFSNQTPEGEQWAELDLWASGDEDGGRSRRAGTLPLRVAPLELSDEVVDADGSITIQTSVQGAQLAYVYVFLGLVSDDEQTLWIEDMDFIDAGASQTVNGVFFPDWGDTSEPVEIEYEFTPIIYAINDGSDEVMPALIAPDDYGDEFASYVVEGIYQFANGSPERYAEIFFRDGEMVKVIGYMNDDGAGAPRQITPRSGDSFVILRQGLNLSEDSEEEFYTELGGTLTFGQTNWVWEEIPAAPGFYVIGIIAEDFDGNQYAEFSLIEIR